MLPPPSIPPPSLTSKAQSGLTGSGKKNPQKEGKRNKTGGKRVKKVGSRRLQQKINALKWRGRYTMSEFYPVKLKEKTFNLSQTVCGERKGLGTGSTVWEGGQILLKFIEHLHLTGKQDFRGKNVIDLGSGTGAVGLVAAVLGANVTLTDQKQVLHLTRHNVKQTAEQTKDPTIVKRVSVHEYNWGESAVSIGAPFDIVLVADCIVPKLYPMTPLVDALLRVSDEKSKIWICYDHRVNSQLDPRVRFRELCEEAGFCFRNVPEEQWHPDFILSDCYIWELRLRGKKRTSNLADVKSPSGHED
ncbi:hypothetical protein AAMO2058_000475800 [Amorphochlora amoebiformis]